MRLLSKKISLFLIALQLTTVSYANFMLGVNTSYLHTTFNDTLKQRFPPTPLTAIQDTAATSTFGIIGGYRVQITFWTMSLLGFYNKDDHATNTYVGKTTTTIQSLNSDYGIKFIPGLYVSPLLNLQGMIGLAIGNSKYRAKGSRNNSTSTYNEPGVLLGAGFDYTLLPSIHAGLNYEFVRYDKKNNISGNDGFYRRNGFIKTNRLFLTLSLIAF